MMGAVFQVSHSHPRRVNFLASQVVKADVLRTRQNIPKFKNEEVHKEMEKLLLIYCKRRSVKYTQGTFAFLTFAYIWTTRIGCDRGEGDGAQLTS